MEPLFWLDYVLADQAVLAAEITTLARDLREWGRANPHPGAVQVAEELDGLRLVRAEALIQSFMPSVDVLRLGFEGAAGARDGIFLRQQVAPGLPRLWPLLDSAANLYAFLDGLPGVLDMTRETVLEYGTFFASEAIVADEGQFTVYPDYHGLPPEYQDAARESLPQLRALTAEPPDPDDRESSELLARAVAHLEAAVEGRDPPGFHRLEYSRDDDEYFFVVFVAYGTGLFAATISVNRATGVPTMSSDAPIAHIEEAKRPARLHPADINPAFRCRDARTPAGIDPAGRTLTGAEAAAVLAAGRPLEDAKVDGDIVLERSTVLTGLTIRSSELGGDLRLPGARIAGDVTFDRVRIGGAVDLHGIDVDGALELDGAELAGGLNLADARVATAVRISSCRAAEIHARRLAVSRGPIVLGTTNDDAFGAIVAGPLDLAGASTPSWISLAATHVDGGVVLANARAGGSVELGPAPSQGVFVRRGLDLSGVHVEGDVAIRSAHIGGPVVMAGGTIAGRLRFGPVHGGAGYEQQGCTVGRDVSLGYARIAGSVTLSGVQIQGALRFELCDLGSLVVEGRLVWDPDGTRVTTLLPSRLRNRLEIRACEIRGELKLSGALVDERYAGRYAIEITSSRVGQAVAFWDEGLAEARAVDDLAAYLDLVADHVQVKRGRWMLQAFAPRSPRGGWPVVMAELPGRGSLGTSGPFDPADEISIRELRANLSARHVFTEIRGDLRMALCRIGGDLCLTNLRAAGRTVVLEGLEVEGDLLAEWTGRRYAAPPGEWARDYTGLLATEAAAVELQGATIKGEARLTGLRLAGRVGSAARPPALAVRYSNVEGVLALCDVRPLFPMDPRSRAALAGDLDVSWSTVDHLVLDGRSLGAGEPEAVGRPNRLVAASATIRKLELRDPLPGEVDLSDAKVNVWDFGLIEGDELLRRFRNVLGNQEPFTRNVYQEVEAYLHNVGFEDLAKDVHVDLVTRQHRDTIARLRTAPPGAGTRWALVRAGFRAGLSRINRFATGNFTSELRPILCCWLPVWLISSCYFADPARVDIASGAKNGFVEKPEPVCAILNHWSFFDSMKLTTRYVLPVVPSVGLDELDAGDGLESHPLCLGTSERIRAASLGPIGRIRSAFDWLRPSTVATWARVLSWLFLSLATGTIFAKMSRTPKARA